MAATIINYGSVTGLIDGREIRVGSIDTPNSFSVAGQRHEETLSIANAASGIIYANSLGAFNTCVIECDYNTRVVLTDTNGATMSLGIRGTGKAGEYGQPFQLTLGTTSDASNTINSIVVHNESGSTAKVHGIVIK